MGLSAGAENILVVPQHEPANVECEPELALQPVSTFAYNG